MPEIAKIFMMGRSQAVRIPEEFRFDGDEVRIRREGNAVVLEPVSVDWSWLDTIERPVDDDFVKAATDRPSGQAYPPELNIFE